MKYTKNIGIKLRLLGFEFDRGHRSEGREFDIYENGIIEVKADHYNKLVTVEINAEYNKVNIKSIEQLEQLSKLINQ